MKDMMDIQKYKDAIFSDELTLNEVNIYDSCGIPYEI